MNAPIAFIDRGDRLSQKPHSRKEVQMKNAWILAITIALIPVLAIAGSRSEVRKQVESSMLLKGVVVVDTDGSVTSSEIDGAEKLRPGLVDFVQKHVKSWKFQPVVRNGKAVRARSNMSMRLVAKKLENGDFTLEIRSANFTGETPKEGEWLSRKSLTPPRYPQRAAMNGVTGSVYVVLKVGRNGQVEDAMIEQVNLRTLGSVNEMIRWREFFADAVLEAAKRWVFDPPTIGEKVDDEFWATRVPVDFRMGGKNLDAYGTWEAYIPGPRQRIPWSEEEQSGFSPDSLADGGIYMLGQGDVPKLLTKLGNGS